MKNIQNTEEDSIFFDEKTTENEKGKILTYKNSNGFSYECTYDERGNQLTFKNSNGYWTEKTYDEKGNQLTFKDSNGNKRGFSISEYTVFKLFAKLRSIFKFKTNKMKNILNTEKNLKLFDENGNGVYAYYTDSNGYTYEYTYDEDGNELTYKNSKGYSYERTYDKNNNELTYKNSKGFSCERTYDENNNELTFGYIGGLNNVEYTTEQLIAKLGDFKLIK